MKEKRTRSKFSIVVRWILWILLVQFILINISAAFYGYKLTYFYDQPFSPLKQSSGNIFAKTWHLFRGPCYFRSTETKAPTFFYDSVKLYTKDSIAIDGWYIPADSAKGTVIIFHGLGVNKTWMLNYSDAFHDMKYNVMLIDLRAHGNSGGHVSTLGVRESEEVKLAYEYVAKKNKNNIVLYGSSLGAVVVAKAIYDYNLTVSGVVLDMPFASLHDHFCGRARILGFPSEPFGTLVTFWAGLERGFNGFKHNTCHYAEKILCPVLMQYAADDKLVLRKETESVFNHIPSSQKKLVQYENAAHEFLLKNDPVKWRSEMEEFLGKLH